MALTSMRQKQGNTEAGSVGSKSVRVTLISYAKHTTTFTNSQDINKDDILLTVNEIAKELEGAYI